MALGAEGVQNPEPLINAVLAALKAQESAFLTNWLLVALLIIAVIAVICAALILSKVITIQEHTNGMQTALVETTRKLALIEGEVKGRLDQRTEDLAEVKET